MDQNIPGMIILLSPAKSLKNTSLVAYDKTTETRLRPDTWKLVKIMKTLGSAELQKLMGISEKLALDNVQRYKAFKRRHDEHNSRSVIDMFDGDVYRGLQAADFSADELVYAQDHLRILSGLYGLLRPFDRVQEYRLEMGTALTTDNGKNLYQFWGDKITKLINKDVKNSGNELIINLASKEYFKALDRKKIKAPILNINFKEYRHNELKFVSFNAKKARGLVARYIVKNKITTSEEIKGFDTEGYYFSEEHSADGSWLFIR